MILYFMSVIWKICLKGFLNSLFCSIVRVGTTKSWIFPQFVKLDSCAVASLLVVLQGIILDVKLLFHSKWEC